MNEAEFAAHVREAEIERKAARLAAGFWGLKGRKLYVAGDEDSERSAAPSDR